MFRGEKSDARQVQKLQSIKMAREKPAREKTKLDHLLL